jgi:hypothetical protein
VRGGNLVEGQECCCSRYHGNPWMAPGTTRAPGVTTSRCDRPHCDHAHPLPGVAAFTRSEPMRATVADCAQHSSDRAMRPQGSTVAQPRSTVKNGSRLCVGSTWDQEQWVSRTSTVAVEAGICCLPQQTETTASVRTGDRPSLRARAWIWEGSCRSTRASAMTRLGRRARSTEGVETAITMHIPFREKPMGSGCGVSLDTARFSFLAPWYCPPSETNLAHILAMLTLLRNPSAADSQS